MQQERYGKEVARIICQLTFMPEALVIRDDGVFVKDEYQEQVKAWRMEGTPMGPLFVWRYSCDMDWPDAPDPLTTPSLPIPFTGHELAAFMLEGFGASIQWHLGSIDDGPNEEVLRNLGMQSTKVCKVLREAYILARNAQEVVGKPDHELEQRAYDLLDQSGDAYSQALERERAMERVITGKEDGSLKFGGFIPRDEYLPRLTRAKESVAAQKAQARQAEEQANAKKRAWRRAMVRQLLQPKAPTPSPAPVVAQSAANGAAPADTQTPTPSPAPEPQAAPVVADSASGEDAPWKEQARTRAYEIIKRDKEKDLYPSQENIADEIAKQFRKDGLKGSNGKPLTGSYIKRHALKGISSAQSKRVSTVTHRGK
jgi:hypothetical protein